MYGGELTMPDGFNRHYKALELDKVLRRLADFASSAHAKQAALGLEPRADMPEAGALVSQTCDAHMLLARFGGPSFSGLIDIGNALMRAEAGSVLTMRELLDTAGVLRVIRGLAQWRAGNKGVESVLDIYFGALAPNKYLEDRITGCILSEDEMADHASPALADIRRKIKLNESKIRQQLEKFARSQSYAKFLQDNIITMRNDRFVIPVKNEYRNEIPGLVHDTSSSGATVFIEPMPVVEANNEIRMLKGHEREEMERILSELSAETGQYAESILSSYECAAELDLIFAKAHFAYEMKASPPELNDKGELNLRAARHPLIDPKTVVPVDIRLGDDFDILVITGPNTGGKTVALKTIGLLSLMAACGLMIPAGDRSKVPVFGKVLADIGDEQSIEQSLSTFSGHITNIIAILAAADENSLVLIDELGAGTDPVEGAALATAILETLQSKGVKAAATTHYAELKAFALQTPRVENGCCEFNVDTLRPTYRLLTGIPGRSNAFAISERLGMEKQVVDRARELVSSENSRFEDVVGSLEESRLQTEIERGRAAELSAKAGMSMLEAQKLKEEIASLRDKEIEEAKKQAAKIVLLAKREAAVLQGEIDKLRREMPDTRDPGELARRARAALKKSVEAIEDAAEPAACFGADEDYRLPRPLVAGDNVIIADIGTRAKVVSPPDRDGNVEIQTGSVKTRVKLTRLRLIQQDSEKKNAGVAKTTGVESRLGMEVATRLDLRGMTVDDCLIELDRFIDQSLRTGLHEFVIVHGKGTGALRAAVRAYLKKSPYVKSHRPGVFGEGEDGVSIVELK